MKAVVAAFNQEKALVGAFSVITNLRMELFEPVHGSPDNKHGGQDTQPRCPRAEADPGTRAGVRHLGIRQRSELGEVLSLLARGVLAIQGKNIYMQSKNILSRFP